MELTEKVVRAAHERLRGQLVATPLIGGLTLPGYSCSAGLRLKPENLQPAGSLWFRGALHHLTRHLGALKGLAITGPFRPVLAATLAAQLLRVPTQVVLAPPEDTAPRRAQLAAAGSTTQVVLDAAAGRNVVERMKREDGLHVMPGLEDVDYVAGVATLGLELADELPADVELVLVSPPELAAPIRRGLAAAGRPLRVAGIGSRSGITLTDLRRALRHGARLDSDDAGLPALAAALTGEFGDCPCVVLSS